MKTRILNILCLLAIILFGSYLRLVNLEMNPNGLYVDEASTGYNAWSILLTGKDEYGKDYPLFFRFLGSYTLPLYTYLTSISIHYLGFNITAIRLVSAISGILLIPLVFLFIKKLNISKNWMLPFLGAFFLAVSPWSIFYSRVGYETNLAFFIYALGLLFLWLSISKKWWIIPACGLLAVSTYTYQTERLLAPLTLISFIFLFKDDFLKKENRKIIITGFIIFLIILSPQISLLFTPASSARGFGLFYDEAIANKAKEMGIVLAFLREFFSQYFSYFSPRNLFFQTDSDLQRSLPELSTFYPWMIFLFIPGIYVLIKDINKVVKKFILMCLILTPIPASLAGDPFSTQRALPLLLPVTLIIIIGLDKLLTTRHRALFLGCVIVLSISSMLYLYRSYGVLLPNERARIWGYGFKQLAEEVKRRPEEKFLIDGSRVKPVYIELAFYLMYPPQQLQQTVNQNIKHNYYENTTWDSHYILGNVETRNINWEEDIYKNQILVGDELAISENQAKEHFLQKTFEIKDPTHRVVFIGYKTNPVLKCDNQFIKNKCSSSK